MNEIYKNLNLDDIEGEIWLPIQDYEDKYAVSNFGRVKSLRDNKGNYREKILKLSKDKDGYLLVNLWKEGKIKTCKVHRLVANAFIPNPLNLPTVNHKNEIKTDNQVDNLEWCTYQYNNTYGTAIQRRVANTDYKAKVANTDYKAIAAKIDWKALGKKLTNRQDQSKQVFQYSLDGTLVKIWSSTQECDRNGFNQGNVAACCRNCYLREGNNVYKRYIWSYHPL